MANATFSIGNYDAFLYGQEAVITVSLFDEFGSRRNIDTNNEEEVATYEASYLYNSGDESYNCGTGYEYSGTPTINENTLTFSLIIPSGEGNLDLTYQLVVSTNIVGSNSIDVKYRYVTGLYSAVTYEYPYGNNFPLRSTLANFPNFNRPQINVKYTYSSDSIKNLTRVKGYNFANLEIKGHDIGSASVEEYIEYNPDTTGNASFYINTTDHAFTDNFPDTVSTVLYFFDGNEGIYSAHNDSNFSDTYNFYTFNIDAGVISTTDTSFVVGVTGTIQLNISGMVGYGTASDKSWDTSWFNPGDYFYFDAGSESYLPGQPSASLIGSTFTFDNNILFTTVINGEIPPLYFHSAVYPENNPYTINTDSVWTSGFNTTSAPLSPSLSLVSVSDAKVEYAPGSGGDPNLGPTVTVVLKDIAGNLFIPPSGGTISLTATNQYSYSYTGDAQSPDDGDGAGATFTLINVSPADANNYQVVTFSIRYIPPSGENDAISLTSTALTEYCNLFPIDLGLSTFTILDGKSYATVNDEKTFSVILYDTSQNLYDINSGSAKYGIDYPIYLIDSSTGITISDPFYPENSSGNTYGGTSQLGGGATYTINFTPGTTLLGSMSLSANVLGFLGETNLLTTQYAFNIYPDISYADISLGIPKVYTDNLNEIIDLYFRDSNGGLVAPPSNSALYLTSVNQYGETGITDQSFPDGISSQFTFLGAPPPSARNYQGVTFSAWYSPPEGDSVNLNASAFVEFATSTFPIDIGESFVFLPDGAPNYGYVNTPFTIIVVAHEGSGALYNSSSANYVTDYEVFPTHDGTQIGSSYSLPDEPGGSTYTIQVTSDTALLYFNLSAKFRKFLSEPTDDPISNSIPNFSIIPDLLHTTVVPNYYREYIDGPGLTLTVVLKDSNDNLFESSNQVITISYENQFSQTSITGEIVPDNGTGDGATFTISGFEIPNQPYQEVIFTVNYLSYSGGTPFPLLFANTRVEYATRFAIGINNSIFQLNGSTFQAGKTLSATISVYDQDDLSPGLYNSSNQYYNIDYPIYLTRVEGPTGNVIGGNGTVFFPGETGGSEYNISVIPRDNDVSLNSSINAVVLGFLDEKNIIPISRNCTILPSDQNTFSGTYSGITFYNDIIQGTTGTTLSVVVELKNIFNEPLLTGAGVTVGIESTLAGIYIENGQSIIGTTGAYLFTFNYPEGFPDGITLDSAVWFPWDQYSFTNIIDQQLYIPYVDHNPTIFPCFFADAPVKTPGGYRRIDSLKKGDLIITSDGMKTPIHKVVKTQVPANKDTMPYIIPKGMFNANRDLPISPNHRINVDGTMIEAKKLGLKRKVCSGTLTYYNIELPTWKNMIIAGVDVESMAPAKEVFVTPAEFKEALVKRYGKVTQEMYETALSKFKVMPDGKIRCYAVRTSVGH